MVSVTNNMLSLVAQRLTSQAKGSPQSSAVQQPTDNAPALKAPPDKTKGMREALRQRTNFFRHQSRSAGNSHPAGARASELIAQAKPAPVAPNHHDGPSVRITGTRQDAKLRELNRRLDKLNGRPVENGKAVSLNQWQDSLEQRLDKLNAKPTENGKPATMSQRQASLEERLARLNSQPADQKK